MRLDTLAALNAELAARRACALVTRLDDGEAWLCRAADPDDRLAGAAVALLREGGSGLVDHEGRRYFVNVHTPPPRLLVTGAVHIAQALAPMAGLAGFDVAIIDPRAAFAAKERFPGARLLAEWPDVALAQLGLDAFTAVAALTHDPRIDDPALSAALASACFYVGALGSRKTHARRLERLSAAGLTAEALARLHAPIGLDIGAASPAEIAVAILAEIIMSLRNKADARGGA